MRARERGRASIRVRGRQYAWYGSSIGLPVSRLAGWSADRRPTPSYVHTHTLASLRALLRWQRHPGKARGDMAMSWNNLGFVLKTAGQFDRAHEAYDRALEMREALLGPAHPDAIATKYNKAECMIAAGDELGAAELQRQILETLEVDAEAGGIGGGEVKEAERVVRTTNDVATFSNRPPKKK